MFAAKVGQGQSGTGIKWDRNKEAKNVNMKRQHEIKKEGKSKDTERNASHLDNEKHKTKDIWVRNRREKVRNICEARRTIRAVSRGK